MEVGTVVQPETAKDPGQVETGPQQAAPRGPREFTGQCQGFPHDGTNKRRRRFNRAEGMDRDHGLFPLFRLLQRQGEGDHITADERCTEARNKTLTGKSMVSLPHNQAKKKKKNSMHRAMKQTQDDHQALSSLVLSLSNGLRMLLSYGSSRLLLLLRFSSPFRWFGHSSQILQRSFLLKSRSNDSPSFSDPLVPLERLAVFLGPFRTVRSSC